MPEQHLEPVVHWFDTAGHRVACGAGLASRSTKYARAVSCPSCVEVLRHRAAGEAAAGEAAAAHAP